MLKFSLVSLVSLRSGLYPGRRMTGGRGAVGHLHPLNQAFAVRPDTFFKFDCPVFPLPRDTFLRREKFEMPPRHFSEPWAIFPKKKAIFRGF